MTLFTPDEKSWSRLDYRLLRAGGISLYYSDSVLERDMCWLRDERHVIHAFDAGRWISEAKFHTDVSIALAFPSYYGSNLDAFNDCIGDMEVPEEGGVALVFPDADSVTLRDG